MDRKNRVDSLRRGSSYGFCSICGSKGLLTRDHVPPRSCGNSGVVVIGGTKYQGGYKARTICQKCNNELLGSNYDLEFKKVYDEYNNIIASQSRLPLFGYLKIKCSQEKLLKCFIGHFLAVSLFNSDDDIQYSLTSDTIPRGKIKEDLTQFFLGTSNLDNYDIYHWIYPTRQLVIMDVFGRVDGLCSSPRGLFVGVVIKMFPLAIYIVNNSNIYYSPYKLQKMDTKSMELVLDFKYLIDEKWPEREPSDDGAIIGNIKNLQLVDMDPNPNT